MEKEGFFTTVVGSFPLSNTSENMIKAFKDQVDIGIDYPCYPQLISMINMFLDPLSELIDALQVENENYSLSGDFNVPSEPIALEYGEFILDFFKKYPGLKKEVKGIKACLTGPFTLASEILLTEAAAKGVKPIIYKEPRAIMVDWIIEKLTEVMKKIGKAYSDMGINIISMDEPILGLLVGRKILFHDKDFVIEMLNKSLSGISGLSSIHVCGSISPLLRDILLKTNCKIMDHEFRTNPRNFEIFERKHFENTDKFLALGTVETKISKIENGILSDYVEDIEFLRTYIKKAIDQYGKENLIIKPDCGFAPLKSFGESFGYEIAFNKLKNMSKVVRELRYT